MSDLTPYTASLEALDAEYVSAEARVRDLQEELEEAALRLRYVQGAIANLRAFIGLTRGGVEPSAEGTPIGAERPEIVVGTPAAPEVAALIAKHADVKVRVPSTEWVADVVNQIGQAADREEIFKRFMEWKNIPSSWSNPRNAFNNALGRAVERGLIQRLEPDLFAPLGYQVPRVGEPSFEAGAS